MNQVEGRTRKRDRGKSRPSIYSTCPLSSREIDVQGNGDGDREKRSLWLIGQGGVYSRPRLDVAGVWPLTFRDSRPRGITRVWSLIRAGVIIVNRERVAVVLCRDTKKPHPPLFPERQIPFLIARLLSFDGLHRPTLTTVTVRQICCNSPGDHFCLVGPINMRILPEAEPTNEG